MLLCACKIGGSLKIKAKIQKKKHKHINLYPLKYDTVSYLILITFHLTTLHCVIRTNWNYRLQNSWYAFEWNAVIYRFNWLDCVNQIEHHDIECWIVRLCGPGRAYNTTVFSFVIIFMNFPDAHIIEKNALNNSAKKWFVIVINIFDFIFIRCCNPD